MAWVANHQTNGASLVPSAYKQPNWVLIIDDSFEVDSAPAIVFLKDPGVKPVVYHGMSLFFYSLFVPLVARELLMRY